MKLFSFLGSLTPNLIFKLDEIFKLVLTENHFQDSRSDNNSYKQETYYSNKLVAGLEQVEKTSKCVRDASLQSSTKSVRYARSESNVTLFSVISGSQSFKIEILLGEASSRNKSNRQTGNEFAIYMSDQNEREICFLYTFYLAMKPLFMFHNHEQTQLLNQGKGTTTRMNEIAQS